MNKIYHKFLVLFSIFIIIGGVYLYFSDSLTSEASLSTIPGSSLAVDSGGSNYGSQIESNISFISTLASLTRINIDTSFFSNKAFQNLRNNTVTLDIGEYGRVNPFAPISDMNNSSAPLSSNVTTNIPAEVKSTSTVLSGSIINMNGLSDAYFEYGTTNKLGKKITSENVSLIGVFVANISDLKPQTTYFYKSCAKINKVTTCGDVVSFNTI